MKTELSRRPPRGTIRGDGKTRQQKARALRERTRAGRGHRSSSICMRDNTTLLALNFCRRTVFHPLRKKPQVCVRRYRNSSRRRTAYTAPPTIEGIERTRSKATGVWLADDGVSFVLFLIQILVSIALPDKTAAKPIFPLVLFRHLGSDIPCDQRIIGQMPLKPFRETAASVLVHIANKSSASTLSQLANV